MLLVWRIHLPFSHDEVVHGKGLMIAKTLWVIAGSSFLANLARPLIYVAHPGKKKSYFLHGFEFRAVARADSSKSPAWIGKF
jgi:1,4-alpha-glucan branching enzyme